MISLEAVFELIRAYDGATEEVAGRA
jgi:hypothetical protein